MGLRKQSRLSFGGRVSAALMVSAVSSLIFGVQSAKAVRSLDFTIHQEYTSTRALGMGNAFIAIADDHNAMFYNPAGLAYRKDGQFHGFLRGGANPELFDLQKEIDQIKGSATEEQDIANLIQSKYGQHYYSRVTTGGMYVRPRWGFAFLPADLSLDITPHQQLGPTLDANGYLDSTLAISYSRPVSWLKGHQISWGTTVKAIHRIHVGQSLLAAQLVDGKELFEKKDANEGLTVDADLGLLWKLKPKGFMKYLKPSFAMVIRNVADYGYFTKFDVVSDQSGDPPNLGRRFDLGSKWDLPNFWVFDPHLAIDIRDIGHENWTFVKGSHAGVELYWKMFNWWKGHWAAGINQGYWTAGLGARFAWFQFDVASFGEEVGPSTARNESRRYMVELSLDI